MFRIVSFLVTLFVFITVSSIVLGHPGHTIHKEVSPSLESQQHADADVHAEMELLDVNELPLTMVQVKHKRCADADKTPEVAMMFEAFVTLKAIKTRWDDRFFISNPMAFPRIK